MNKKKLPHDGIPIPRKREEEIPNSPVRFAGEISRRPHQQKYHEGVENTEIKGPYRKAF